MTRHLVTGGAGFIGRHLCRNLAQRGDMVCAVDRSFGPGSTAPDVHTVTADLFSLSLNDLADLITDYDVIHHLAWSTVPALAEADPEKDLCTNTAFMVRLLEALKNTGKRLLFCSSGGTVYGLTTDQPVTEDSPLQPIGAYGAGKAAAEIYAQCYRFAHGLDIRVARVSNPFGAGQSPVRPQGAVSRFVFEALANRPLAIWGDGRIVRDYIHILDVAEGLARLALAPRNVLPANAAINIASGSGVSLNEVISRLSLRLGREVAVVYSEARNYDVPFNILSIDRATERLDWRPRLTFSEGLEQMISDIEISPGSLFSSTI